MTENRNEEDQMSICERGKEAQQLKIVGAGDMGMFGNEKAAAEGNTSGIEEGVGVKGKKNTSEIGKKNTSEIEIWKESLIESMLVKKRLRQEREGERGREAHLVGQ